MSTPLGTPQSRVNGHANGADLLGALGYSPAERERPNCSPTAGRRAHERLRQALLELSVAEPSRCADLLDATTYEVWPIDTARLSRSICGG